MSTPTKRTPENRARLVELLAVGTTKTAACAAVRISRETLNEWLKDDEEFRLDVDEAIQDAITRNVRLIQEAAQPRPVKKTRTEFATRKDKDGKPIEGKVVKVAQTVEEYVEAGDWRAAHAWLQSMDRENWGKNIDVTSGGQPIQKAYVGFDPDDPDGV